MSIKIIDACKNQLTNVNSSLFNGADSCCQAINAFCMGRAKHIDKISSDFAEFEDKLDSSQGLFTSYTLEEFEQQKAKLKDEYVVDESGIIHQLSLSDTELRLYEATEYIKVADVIVGTENATICFVSEDAKTAALTSLEAFGDLATDQGMVVDYISDLSEAASQEGNLLSAVVTNGMNSSNDTIRALANDVATSGASAVPTNLLSYVTQGITGVARSGDVNETDQEQGWRFSIDEQYTPAVTKNVLVGVWDVLSGAVGLISSVAMMCGQPLIGAIAAAGYGIFTLAKNLANKIASNSEAGFGDGSSPVYANGVKLTFTFSGDIKPMCRLGQAGLQMNTPWGSIYVEMPEGEDDGALHEVAHVKTLFIPNATAVYATPYVFSNNRPSNFTNDYFETGIYPTRDASEYANYHHILNTNNDEMQYWTLEPNFAYQSLAKFWPRANLSSLLFFFISLVYEESFNLFFVEPSLHVTPVITQPVENAESIDSRKFHGSYMWPKARDGERGWLGHEDDFVENFTGYFAEHFDNPYSVYESQGPWEISSLEQFDKWLQRSGEIIFGANIQHAPYYSDYNITVLDPDPDATERNGFATCMFNVFKHLVNAIDGSAYSIYQNYAAWMQVGVERLFTRMFEAAAEGSHACAFNQVAHEYNETARLFYMSVTPMKYTHPALIISPTPKIPSVPYVTPPKYNRWSMILSGLIVAVVTIGAFIAVKVAKKAWRKKRIGKAVKAEARLDAAQKAYLADPSAENMTEYYKASRKYSRVASRVGYSSNSVGTFSCFSKDGTESTMSKLSGKFNELTAQDTSIDIVELSKMIGDKNN